MDYYKNSKDFKGIPISIEHPKRDYYVPEEKKEEKKEIPVKKERKLTKDWEHIAKIGKEKFYRDYTTFPLFKRRAIILTIRDKSILTELVEYEKNDKLKTLIKDILNRI